MSETVANLWSTLQQQRAVEYPVLGWLDSLLVQHLYVRPQITGTADKNWLIWLVENLEIPRDGHWLSIGCGAGGLERFAVEEGLCTEIDGVDIAPGAIEMAVRNAAESGMTNVRYQVRDLDRARLPECTYDVVLCAMSLHHIRRLEYFYEEVVQSLRPGGWLLLNEFVGPSQWQWTDQQLNAVNTLLAALPERLRVNTVTGLVKEREERPSIAWMNAVDPSESIRSAELLPLLESQFTLALRRDYGGAVLGKLLEQIIANFDPERPEDVMALRLLFAAEATLMRAGVLSSDFSVVAAHEGRSLRAARLPFDAAFERHLVYGFHPVEHMPSGEPFAWTEGEAAFVLRRPPHARALRLSLILPPVARTLSIEVDGQLVGALRSTACAAVPPPTHLTLALPPHTRAQPTILLHLDQGWCPSDVWASQDPRTLGVALAGAELL
ncbi:MAG: class I SAM-dependent methyltransferase [Chloroflexales bacterium]